MSRPACLWAQSRPYPTSSYYGGGAYGGYSSIQQLQIGVTLEVTPLINPDGLVVMDIHTKIDSFEGNVTIQNVGDVPITSSKEASAKVSVRDHDTIILGGLIETDKNKSASGVPLLMDIPAVGLSVSQFERRRVAQRTHRADSPDGAADAGDCGAGGDGGEEQDAGGAGDGKGNAGGGATNASNRRTRRTR